MEFRPLGQSGIQASVVGLGAWAIGGWAWGGTEEARSIRAIQAALDEGITLIDTAPAYGLGLSETIVGKAITGRRDKLVLATKCGLVWHVQKGQHFFDQGGRPVHRYLGPVSIRHEVEQSLTRLNTDYIDLYQTHWQDSTTPIEEAMGALLDLKRQGKIRAIGVSNCPLDQLKEYCAVGPVDVAQEKYSMLDRELEAEHIPYCREHNIAVLAYSPLVYGLLTGKIGPERKFPPDDLRHHDPRFTPQGRRRVLKMLDEIRPIARGYDLTLAQLVIAWTLAQPGITHALVGIRDENQARENAPGGSAVMSREDIEAIDQAVRRQAPGPA